MLLTHTTDQKIPADRNTFDDLPDKVIGNPEPSHRIFEMEFVDMTTAQVHNNVRGDDYGVTAIN